MLDVVLSAKFKKDYKSIKKRKAIPHNSGVRIAQSGFSSGWTNNQCAY